MVTAWRFASNPGFTNSNALWPVRSNRVKRNPRRAIVRYVAAKHGLEGLSKVVALEGGPKGVTSNCISPAYVRTPLVEKQIAAQAKSRGIPESEVIDKVMLAESAVKRLVEAREVAELAVYLCSPEAALINGGSLCSHGGAN